MLSYQCSVCFYISDFNKLQSLKKSMKQTTVRLNVFCAENIMLHSPQEVPEIGTIIFGWIESTVPLVKMAMANMTGKNSVVSSTGHQTKLKKFGLEPCSMEMIWCNKQLDKCQKQTCVTSE